jgi:hypothetical protein
MSESLHSIFTAIYHLSIALLTVSHKEIGLTRINRKVNLNATTVPYNSYTLNAQIIIEHKVGFKIKYKEYCFNAPGLALIPIKVSGCFDLSLLHLHFKLRLRVNLISRIKGLYVS